jgi:hypothetical protein
MSTPYLRTEAEGMEILSDYRTNALIVSERELALRAERVRVAEERALRPALRPVTSTGSLVVVPSASH